MHTINHVSNETRARKTVEIVEQNGESAPRLTKQGRVRARRRRMDGVRGFGAIRSQKLGGFRALWLHCLPPWLNAAPARWIVLSRFAAILFPWLKGLHGARLEKMRVTFLRKDGEDNLFVKTYTSLQISVKVDKECKRCVKRFPTPKIWKRNCDVKSGYCTWEFWQALCL